MQETFSFLNTENVILNGKIDYIKYYINNIVYESTKGTKILTIV